MANTTTTANSNSRSQFRAVCPHCFATQAIRKSGKLVQHGYTRPQNWHSNEGTCRGTRAMHFGTTAGRDYTVALISRLDEQAVRLDETAVKVLAGEAQVLTTKRLASRLVMEVVMENPSERDRQNYASRLRMQAEASRKGAVELRATVDAWQPAEPVEVVVEDKAPLTHYRGGYWVRHGGRKACAASLRAALASFLSTEDVAKVTCEKCRATEAYAAAVAKVAA